MRRLVPRLLAAALITAGALGAAAIPGSCRTGRDFTAELISAASARGMFSYDNFFEVMRRYPTLGGFWIDNDNAYWERNDLYAKNGTEGGGYSAGELKPGRWNDGAYGVTTVSRTNPDLHDVHVIDKPTSGTSLVLRDNGYRVARVTNL